MVPMQARHIEKAKLYTHAIKVHFSMKYCTSFICVSHVNCKEFDCECANTFLSLLHSSTAYNFTTFLQTGHSTSNMCTKINITKISISLKWKEKNEQKIKIKTTNMTLNWHLVSFHKILRSDLPSLSDFWFYGCQMIFPSRKII